MANETKKTMVITVDDAGEALVRLFDSEDMAFDYNCKCRMSSARRIMTGITKKAWSLDALKAAVSESYDIPLVRVQAAYNMATAV